MMAVPAIGTMPVTPENHAMPSRISSTTLCAAAANRNPASLRSAYGRKIRLGARLCNKRDSQPSGSWNVGFLRPSSMSASTFGW